jgi:hypothetical protein
MKPEEFSQTLDEDLRERYQERLADPMMRAALVQIMGVRAAKQAAEVAIEENLSQGNSLT